MLASLPKTSAAVDYPNDATLLSKVLTSCALRVAPVLANTPRKWARTVLRETPSASAVLSRGWPSMTSMATSVSVRVSWNRLRSRSREACGESAVQRRVGQPVGGPCAAQGDRLAQRQGGRRLGVQPAGTGRGRDDGGCLLPAVSNGGRAQACCRDQSSGGGAVEGSRRTPARLLSLRKEQRPERMARGVALHGEGVSTSADSSGDRPRSGTAWPDPGGVPNHGGVLLLGRLALCASYPYASRPGANRLCESASGRHASIGRHGQATALAACRPYWPGSAKGCRQPGPEPERL